MRPFWLAAKIAVFFALMVAIALVGTLWLFGRVAGHAPVLELGLLRAREGVATARALEAVVAGRADPAAAIQGDPEIAARLAAEARARGLRVTLEKAVPSKPRRRWNREPWHALEILVEGRLCKVQGPPLEIEVPVLVGERRIATLRIEGAFSSKDAHAAFVSGLLHIGGLTLAGVVGLALYLAAPVRRMSRSMDRIALGELGHRVEVRGRDEVAAMGRSFNAMADRIAAMLQGQKELLAAVSHELRSPLARMKLSLELMRDGASEARLAELESEVDAIDALVGELLFASRFELGPVPLELETLELAGLAREAWGRVETEAEAGGSTLGLQLAEGAREVSADRNLALRILGNLFENAVRYAPGGEVRLETVRRGERVELRVGDAGPGVAEEHLDRLFEPFFRADPSRSRATGASGLGLMIVRRAVEAHGGSVRAERSAAGGLAVRFDLAVG